MTTQQIIYTEVDEAPALATYSLLPILQAYTRGSGIVFEKKDISLAGRIIANFPEKLTESQRLPDYLGELGKLVKQPTTNVIKLPNISASIPQLKAAIKELQEKGYDIPDYPEVAKSEADKELQKRFAKVLGSAVNPVLREGNSDRRAAASVKEFGKKNPHKLMKPWPAESKSRVAHMTSGDFYGSEKSVTRGQGLHGADRVCGCGRRHHRPQGEAAPAGRRDPRCFGDECRGAAEVLRRADRGGQKGRASCCPCT